LLSSPCTPRPVCVCTMSNNTLWFDNIEPSSFHQANCVSKLATWHHRAASSFTGWIRFRSLILQVIWVSMCVYLVLTSCILTTINQGRMKEPPLAHLQHLPRRLSAATSIYPFLPCQRIRLTSSFTSQLLPPHAVSAISDGIIVVFFGHSVMDITIS
jgi:hypothetical protein